MPKKNTGSRALVPAAKTTTYPIANTRIEALQLFRVRERHPKGHGPWQDEHEKIAWVDPATGLHCTILRQRDGALSGWVAVPPGHELFGFSHDAIPSEIGLRVHGGIEEAGACDEHGPESVSVCHPSEAQDDALWWFGFACDKSYDYVPGTGAKALAAENGQTYRTEGYVFEQCTSLARQLAAIGAEGEGSGTPLEPANCAPPVGLDPEGR